MISVLVLGFSTASGQSPASSDIVRTLAALVPGTVEGIFRDVTLLSTESNVDLAKVADHAGCALVEAATFQKAVVAGAARARCEVLLILPAGVTFDRSLSDEIAAAALQPDEAMDLALRLQSVDAGVLGRLVPTTIPSVGLLASRSRLLNVTADTFPALVRACRASRSFKTRAWAGE